MTDPAHRPPATAHPQDSAHSTATPDPGAASGGLSLDYRAHSETGPVRRTNQASAYVSPTMLVVADGMGGAAAGDLASSVAIAELKRSDAPRPPDEMLEVLAGAMNRANDRLADLIAWDHQLDGMGTTVCGAMYGQGVLQMVHIGDSRAYLLRDGDLARLTHDDSWVQSLVDDGKITEAEAAVHPHRSLLLKVLNGQPTHDPDYPTLALRAGDRLLFCSDGLCGLVDDQRMRELMLGHPLDRAVTSLVDAAHRAGGYDNITLILADVVPFDPTLQAAPPQTLGAAEHVDIPKVAPAGVPGDNGPTAIVPAVDAAGVPEPGDQAVPPDAAAPVTGASGTSAPMAGTDTDERIRYTPMTRRRRRKWPWITAIAVALVLIGGGLFGAYHYVTTQFYIAPAGGQVAIYKGLPDSVVGVRLGTLAEQHSTQISDLPSYYADQVRGRSIHAGSLDQARNQANYLDEVASTCVATRQARSSASAAGSPQPSAAVSASASASASGGAGSIGAPVNTGDCP
ncbi:MAG: protein phosphatase 2C domain-containing protein [Propionibacterium sp.]|nr:protein phosphatase 2C domain-containing protein [Propionibacterium sp.]